MFYLCLADEILLLFFDCGRMLADIAEPLMPLCCIQGKDTSIIGYLLLERVIRRTCYLDIGKVGVAASFNNSPHA